MSVKVFQDILDNVMAGKKKEAQRLFVSLKPRDQGYFLEAMASQLFRGRTVADLIVVSNQYVFDAIRLCIEISYY